MERPHIKDEVAWRMMIIQHRWILFERVLAEFPEIKKNDKVYLWKARLCKSL